MSKQPSMEKAAVQKEQSTAWFDELISTLRVHELQLNTGTMNPEMKKLYDVMIAKNLDELFRLSKVAAQEFFVKKIVFDYLRLLEGKLPHKLAFDFNDSEVLVWAEIADNDHAMEQLLAHAEAKMNAVYHPYGFDMESMIVETGDKLQIPNHYKVFK